MKPNSSVTSIADRLKRTLGGEPDLPSISTPEPLAAGSAEQDPALLEHAKTIYRARMARSRFLSSSFFGEPAWDILLVLYIEAGERPMNATSAALVAQTSETTALRWADALQGEGLIESHPHLSDKRLRLLRLSPRGRAIIDQYLREMLHR